MSGKTQYPSRSFGGVEYVKADDVGMFVKDAEDAGYRKGREAGKKESIAQSMITNMLSSTEKLHIKKMIHDYVRRWNCEFVDYGSYVCVVIPSTKKPVQTKSLNPRKRKEPNNAKNSTTKTAKNG